MNAGRHSLLGRVAVGGPTRLLTAAVAAVAAVALAVAPTQPAQAQDAATAFVRVVHGLRGLVADVYLNGQVVLPTFQPERSTEALSIPAGDHVVEIRAAGAAMTERPVLSEAVSVPAGFQGSLVAHLDGAGVPTVSLFADDLTALPAGQSRIVVRHTAATSDVSVLLNDRVLGGALRPRTETAQLISAGQYQLAVTAASGGVPLAPPQAVDYAEGTSNLMYLIGSQADDTLGWAVVRLTGLQTPPARIQTGDGTSADARPAIAWWPHVVAVGVVTGGAIWLRSRRVAADR